MQYASILHIGLHKTGSSSIQAFLSLQRDLLHSNGLNFYTGMHDPANHVELHVAAMRPDRYSTFKLKTGLSGTREYRDAVRTHILAQQQAYPAETLVFSGEGTSLLAHADELRSLHELLPQPVRVVAYLRNPQDYVASHRSQLAGSGFGYLADDPASILFLGEGTWLTDYEARLKEFRLVFGPENVLTFDYDAEVRERGSVVPSFIERVLCIEDVPTATWEELYLNKRR